MFLVAGRSHTLVSWWHQKVSTRAETSSRLFMRHNLLQTSKWSDFCWSLQFLSHLHQGFGHYCSTTFQSYQKRLQIQKWSSESGCSSRFQGSPTATNIRPGHGFSSIRPPVFTHHRCSYRYSWIYWWVRSNFNANWSTWQPLHHFVCFPANKKLFPFSTGSSCCSMGDGSIQRIFMRKTIHSFHWPQAFGKVGSSLHYNA